MAKATLPVLILLVFFFFISGRVLKAVDAEKTWCLAKPSSDQPALHGNLDYACSKVDCQILQPGSPCFDPNTAINHASVAMNLYYKAIGGNYWDCYFTNSGLIVSTDPSYGNCIYAYRCGQRLLFGSQKYEGSICSVQFSS